MLRYEVATLTVAGGTAPRCGPAVAAFCAEGGGRLLGCFTTEFGTLNRVLVLRGFDDDAALRAEHLRTLRAASPFGCGEWLRAIESDSYAPLDFVPPVETGARGPFYEFRSYICRPDGLTPTIESWRPMLPARLALSPLLIAMHALDGPPRFTHIWPYPSLDAREAIRADAIARGIWPPKGAAFLTDEMRSWLLKPLPGSPLT